MKPGTQIGVLLATLAAGASSSLAAFRFTHLTVTDGLSQSDVRAIVQDRQGFMWFGTWLGGLNRYDGYAFKVYMHDEQDKDSIGCDRIQTLYVDHNGVLWVGTDEGVDRYERATDSFVHFRHRDNDPSTLPGYQARFFYEDDAGNLWVSSSAGLSRLDRTSGRFITFTGDPKDATIFRDASVRPLCLDRTTGLLWVGSGSLGVCAVDRATGHFTRYKNDPDDASSLTAGGVQYIYQDRTGGLWISTTGGLNLFDPQTHKLTRYRHDPANPASLSDDYVTATCEDGAGRFWVATINGLNLMDRARGTFTRLLHDPNDPFSLSSKTINWGALYVDRSGAMWAGMRYSGVNRLTGLAERFTTYRHNPQDANSPASNPITGLAIGSAGALWIGTEAGLDRFDGTFTHYLANPNDPSRLSPGPQRVVAEENHGVVWTGTYGGGLDRLKGERVTHFRHDPKNSDSLASDNIASLVTDTAVGVWIGVSGEGIDYFDGQHFTHFPQDQANPVGLPSAYVLPLMFDRRGALWICGWNLVRFDPRVRQFKTFLIDPNQSPNSPANWTADLYDDGTNFWVAAATGLYRFDPETGKFPRRYTEKDGLANNSTLGVQGDAQGNLWVSTINGLSRFDPRTEGFRNYDESDGLQGNEFRHLARARAPDGRLYFGGVNGLSAFYPDKLADNPTPPPVALTEFELYHQPAKVGGKNSPLLQAIPVASNIVLHGDQSVFSFQFAALNYDSPQKNRYAYKLEGFDDDWQYADASRRLATYTHLDPGDYTFRVKASNNDGVWNDQGVALHVAMLAPWWRTIWSRAVGVAVLVALIWLGHRFRVRELEEREKTFREAVESIPALAFVTSSIKERVFLNRGWVEYTGLNLEQTSGSGWQAAVHPDDIERVFDKWRTAAAKGEAHEHELRLRRGGTGEYRWFHLRVVPLRDKRGRIVKWCGLATDMEERKRAEEALRSSDAERRRAEVSLQEARAGLEHASRAITIGALTASIAHEVNQPLAGVVTSAHAGLNWLAANPPNLSRIRQALERVLRDSTRAGDVISRIRGLLKRTPPKKAPVSLNQIVRDVLAFAAGALRANKIETVPALDPNLPTVLGDAIQLQQVLLNLTTNAIEAMAAVSDTRRTLRIQSSLGELEGRPAVVVAVSDTGIGFGNTDGARLFEAFHTTKPQGMGMGLWISRSIVEEHGGRLTAQANSGPGASFVVMLPVESQVAA